MPIKNATIRIYDKNVKLLAEIDNYSKLTFKRSFFKVGSFKLVTGRNINSSEYLVQDNLIALSNSKVGVIDHVVYSQNGDTDIIEVSGYELKGLIKRRITLPTTGQSHQSFSNKDGETIIKGMVDYNCVNAVDSDRDIPNLTILTNLNRGLVIDFDTRLKPLNDEVSKAAKLTDIGTVVKINTATKEYEFDVFTGKDLTKGGPSSNPVQFSTDFDNIENQRYIESKLNSANYAVIGGQGQGVARAIEEIGSSSGLDRREVFVDARDLSTTAGLIARGNERLSDMEALQSFDCTILDKTSYTYEEDYDIGDVVTIFFKPKGLKINKRIEYVTEYYSGGGFQVAIVFGEELKEQKEYIDNSSDYAAGGVQ